MALVGLGKKTNATHSPRLRGMRRDEAGRVVLPLSEVVGDRCSERLQLLLQGRGLAEVHLGYGGRRITAAAGAQKRQACDILVAAGPRNLTQRTDGGRFDAGECRCIRAFGLLILLDLAFTFGDLF